MHSMDTNERKWKKLEVRHAMDENAVQFPMEVTTAVVTTCL